MTYAVRRADGRTEIRESELTPKGPRSRTLATFRVLTNDVAEQAVRRARTPITPQDVHQRARRAGAHVAGSRADAAAAEVLWQLEQGSALSERLRRLLVDRLGVAPPVPDQARQTGPWSGATPYARGQALLDVLGLGDALPVRPKDGPAFPRLRSRAS